MTESRDPLALEVMDRLVQTSFTVMALLSQVASAHDMSLTQLRVLAILRDHQPKMAELAAHLGLERSSVSGLIDRAVKRGLVRREASSDDGRAVRVIFTEEGERLNTLMIKEMAILIAPMTDGLPPADLEQLHGLLTRILNAD